MSFPQRCAVLDCKSAVSPVSHECAAGRKGKCAADVRLKTETMKNSDEWIQGFTGSLVISDTISL